MQISATTPNALLPASLSDDAVAAPQVLPPSPADALAVTVTLSPEAQAAQKAAPTPPAPMSMADAVKQLAPGAQGQGKVAQAKSLLLKLADGSGVPKAEQVRAYSDLQKLVFADPDNAWFTQSTAEDRRAYAAIMDGGAISQEIRKAADDFNAWSLSQDTRSNVPRKALARLTGLSPLEQQMVFAGTAGADGKIGAGATSLDQWKAQMQADIADVDAMLAADASEKKAGKSGKATIQPKNEAEAANDAKDDAASTASEQALAAATSPDQGDGVAAAALKMLQKAAEARADTKERAEQDRKDADRHADGATRPILQPYVIGEKINRTI
ncbi:MAG: hypothetical protein J7521_22945 [Caulobacter sp.]|nr:hypothetical protein [Caulobacter sp.]